MLPAVDVYYSQFEEHLPHIPHSADKKKDRLIYNNTGINFLHQSKPETVYYGRYVTELNDFFIYEGFKMMKGDK